MSPSTRHVARGGLAVARELWIDPSTPDDRIYVVVDDSHAIRTLELRMVKWTPGQCRTQRSSWDQHRWNPPEDQPSEPPELHGTPQRGDEVHAGEYRVRAVASQGTATSVPFELQR